MQAVAGRVVRGPAITHDLFTTVVSAAGAPIPGSQVDAVDGIDLTPVLAGADAPLRPLVWHMPHFWGIRGPGIEPYSAVRLGDHKLIWFHAAEMPPRGEDGENTGSRYELYDLSHDPGEQRDLASSEPAARCVEDTRPRNEPPITTPAPSSPPRVWQKANSSTVIQAHTIINLHDQTEPRRAADEGAGTLGTS